MPISSSPTNNSTPQGTAWWQALAERVYAQRAAASNPANGETRP